MVWPGEQQLHTFNITMNVWADQCGQRFGNLLPFWKGPHIPGGCLWCKFFLHVRTAHSKSTSNAQEKDFLSMYFTRFPSCSCTQSPQHVFRFHSGGLCARTWPGTIAHARKTQGMYCTSKKILNGCQELGESLPLRATVLYNPLQVIQAKEGKEQITVNALYQTDNQSKRKHMQYPKVYEQQQISSSILIPRPNPVAN